uniref:Uncharacterized protein n=1 Tax=Oryza punctata TaxID=4537 RepID=A0A0E0MC12_ORYPU
MGLAKIQERLKTSTIRLFVEKTLKHILTGNPSVLPLVETLCIEVGIETQMFCSLYSNPLDLDDIVDHPHYISRQNALILEHMVIDPKGTSNTPLFGQKAAVEEKLAPALGSHRSKYTS